MNDSRFNFDSILILDSSRDSIPSILSSTVWIQLKLIADYIYSAIHKKYT